MYQATAVRSMPSVSSGYPRVGATVPLDAVRSAGAYVCHWSGHLLRIPQHSLRPHGKLMLNIVGGEPLMVTKISANADVAVSEARGLAWCHGLSVAF
jgi:hypothetical protein